MKLLNKIIASVMSISLVSAAMVMPMTASAIDNPDDYVLLYKIYENNKNQKRGELGWGWWYNCWDVTNNKQYRDDCEQYTLKRVEDEEYSLNIDFTNTKHIRFNSSFIGHVKQSTFDISGAIEAGGYISFKMYDVSTAENTNDLWMSMSHNNGWKWLDSSSPMAQYIKGHPTNQWVTVEIPMSVFKESFFEGLNTSAVKLTGIGSSTNDHNLYIQDFNVYTKKLHAKASIEGSGVDSTARPYVTVAYNMAMSSTAADKANYTLKANGEDVLASEVVYNAEDGVYNVFFPNTLTLDYPGDYTLVISENVIDDEQYKVSVSDDTRELEFTTPASQDNVVVDGTFTLVPNALAGTTKITYTADITSIYETDAADRNVKLILAVKQGPKLALVNESAAVTLNERGTATADVTVELDGVTSVIDSSDISVYVVNSDDKPLCEVQVHAD